MALTGSLYNNTCYSSASEATNAYFSSILPSISTGVPAYLTEYVKISGIWNIRTYSTDAAGTQTLLYTRQATYPSFPFCDPMQSFNDGLTVGSALLVAVVTAVIFGIISKAK